MHVTDFGQTLICSGISQTKQLTIALSTDLNLSSSCWCQQPIGENRWINGDFSVLPDLVHSEFLSQPLTLVILPTQ